MAGAVIFLAVVTFNSWLLALLVNRPLFLHGGSVSELSVRGQPEAFWFMLLGLASGLLFAAFGLLADNHMPGRQRSRDWLVNGTILFGLANIIDSLMRLPCSETINKSCVIPVVLNPRHYDVPAHAYSSALIAVLYLALPMAGIIYARARKWRWFEVSSWIAALSAAISMLSALWEYVSLHSVSVRASGIGQAVQMIILGVWFLSLYFSMQKASAS